MTSADLKAASKTCLPLVIQTVCQSRTEIKWARAAAAHLFPSSVSLISWQLAAEQFEHSSAVWSNIIAALGVDWTYFNEEDSCLHSAGEYAGEKERKVN